jgi:hypothetical protein
MLDAMNCGKLCFAGALALLLNSLEQLIKTFGDNVAAPVAEALAKFMAQIPGHLRVSMLLSACIF